MIHFMVNEVVPVVSYYEEEKFLFMHKVAGWSTCKSDPRSEVMTS